MISDSQNNFGQWNVRIRTVPGRDDRGRPLAAAPQELLDLFAVTDGPDALLGHIIVTAQKFDPEEVDVLEMSRYTGVLRASAFTGDQVELSGVGLIWHLGDLDGYKVISTEIDLDTEGFEDGINLILPPAIEAGDIVPEVGAESARYLYVTYRSALEDWLSLFAAEYYLTPQGRLNAGTAASLFPSFNNPTTFIIRKGTGIDPNLRPLPLSSLTLAGDASDFATEVVSLVQVEDESFIEGGASGATAKRDLHGNLLDITIVNNETSTIAQNVDARAAARLAQAQSPQTSVELSTENYDVHGEFRPGDAVWVYDKASGAHDMANEVEFRGDTYWPIKLRVLAITYPVVEGMGVYFKHPVSGEIYDLTPYAVWEPAGSSQIEVAAFTRSLLPPSSGGIGGVIAPVVNPGAPPGIPDPPSVFGDERTLFVVVPTTTGGGSPQPSNVTTMRVYASTSSGFTPGPTNYIGSIPVSKANISLGQNVRGAFEWFDTALTYVRVSGVNTVEGPASAEVSDAATLIESAAILSLVANKIDAGTISASVEMTAATITGGLVRTAVSGNRLEIAGVDPDRIDFYTGEVGEINPATIQVFDSKMDLVSPEFVANGMSNIRLTGKAGPAGEPRAQIEMFGSTTTPYDMDWFASVNQLVFRTAGGGFMAMNVSGIDLISMTSGSRLLLNSSQLLHYSGGSIRFTVDSGVSSANESDTLTNFNSIGERRLVLGAADSDGAGFRTVKAPN